MADLAQLNSIAEVVVRAVFFICESGFQADGESNENTRHGKFDHGGGQSAAADDEEIRET